MKKILTIITLCTICFTTSWAQQSNKQTNSITHRSWKLIITPESQKTYLDSVAKSWLVNHIVLKFTTMEYNKQGKLVKIKGTVVTGPTKDAPSGTFTSDNLKAIQILVTDQPSVDIRVKDQK